MSAKPDIAYTLSGSVIIPDRYFDWHECLARGESHTFVRLRGSAYTVAVYYNDACIGWAVKTPDMKVEDR